MKFIEKNTRSLDHSRIVSRMTLSEEIYGSVLQETFQVLAERSAKLFHDEFGQKPHPSWFAKREFLQPMTDSVLIEVTVTLPMTGTEIILEGERFAWRMEIHHTSRLPLVEKSPFVNPELLDVVQLQTRWAEHTGWDADSGLMVFGG